MKKPIVLCAICNVQSGNCSQDCAYCAQSARYDTGIEAYKQKSVQTVVQEAKNARANGALGFCLVTSGVSLDDKKVEFISKTAKAIKKEVDGLMLIACNGIADINSLLYLKKSGIDSYNHNLETASSFFKNICTTHTWHQRYETCENVKSAGLMLCSGGIFGLGESRRQSMELLEELRTLQPHSMPINFYYPNAALPIKVTPLSVDEALNIIKTAKSMMSQTMLMVAGGREFTFGSRQSEIFDAGCDAIVVGDYLTVSGQNPTLDRKMIEEAGCEVAISCDH